MIFKYLAGLPVSARSFIDRWSEEHEPYNKDGTTKPRLHDVIHLYQGHCLNPMGFASTSRSGIAPLAHGLAATHIGDAFEPDQAALVAGGTSGTSKPTRRVLPGAVAGHSREIVSVVPHCNYCNKDFHVEGQCREKHPHLKAAHEKALAEGKGKNKKKNKKKPTGGNGGNGGNGAKRPKPDDDEEWGTTATLAIPLQRTPSAFAGVSTPSNQTSSLSTPCTCKHGHALTNGTPHPSKKWVLDCGCTQHMSGDPSAFISFHPMPDRPVGGIGGSLVVTSTGSVRLQCRTQKGLTRSIIIHNV